MNRLQMSQLGRVARCSACGVRHWRPAAGAPGANLHGATWQQWHADSLAAGAPVLCELCHLWRSVDPVVLEMVARLAFPTGPAA